VLSQNSDAFGLDYGAGLSWYIEIMSRSWANCRRASRLSEGNTEVTNGSFLLFCF
jgi:hypothetical protein